MRADIEVLTANLAEVHPNLNFVVSPAEAKRRTTALMERCATPLAARRFNEMVTAYVAGFGDDHTVAYPLPGMRPPQTKTTAPDSWRFERLAADIGYIDFRLMRDRPAWQRFLAATFQTLNTERVPALIVDLRHNVGGDSRLGDDLLGYWVTQPYRPISRKSWRFSPAYLAQMKTADPWGLETGDPQQAPPPEFQRLFAQNPTPEFKAVITARASHRVREILARHAPHWLDLRESALPPAEILSLDLPLAPPPAQQTLRFTGRVCFLIGRETFSSAVILANTVEDFGLAPLIGEDTKPCNQFGEPYRFVLPHSRVSVDVATAQYVRANGDATSPHGVRPTIPVPANGSAENDNVLGAAIAWARQP